MADDQERYREGDDRGQGHAGGGEANGGDTGEIIGSAAIRPVFLGNLMSNYNTGEVTELFTRPIVPPGMDPASFSPIRIDRIDLKRGYCFVFLKDANSQEEKDQVERFVSAINGMEIENLSTALRAEFARGDGRVKRKEDDRRKHINPSETLFVVNFHEETTKREDLQMLFEPFGELVRIDLKRNYAFVQFRTIEEATRAKESTNGGKLDQSVLTVEYVANQRGDGDRPGRGRRRDDFRGDRRGGDRRGGSDRFGGGGRGPDRFDRDRPRDGYNDFRGGRQGGRDDFRGRGGRERSPVGYRGASPGAFRGNSPGAYRSGSPLGGSAGGGGGGRYRGGRTSRSRSRSPPRGYRSSRSPPRRAYDDRERGGRYEDSRGGDVGGRRGGGGAPGGGWSPDGYRDRGRSPEGYRGGARDDRGDRGYRP